MRRAVLLPLALALLAGCASDPKSELRADAEAAIEAANERDADGVREHAQSLERTVARLAEDDELTDARAASLTALAASLQTSADVIDEDLLEQRRREAEAEAEAKRLEEERARLEAERKQLEEDRKRAEEEGKKDEGKDEEGKGKGKDDD